MNVVSRKTLRAFWERCPLAEKPLVGWYKVVSAAEWQTPHDIRAQYNTADFVSDSRVIFDLGGNKYRIVARVSYTFKAVQIKFVGTHDEYDKIDPSTV